MSADIGLIGLSVMGSNLVLNMNDHGFTVCAFNRTVSKVDEFLANEAKGTKVIGAQSIEDLMGKLKKPRRVVMLVKAGQAVDDFIELILPFTEEGDIIIDGGNSLFTDSIRRTHYLEGKKRLFVGAGVSGGEEGARNGPSIMPGGSADAWPHLKEIMQSISAKAGANEPCCQWVGGTGSGHYVKMVHNGIEYGDMQLCCEAYHLMQGLLGMSCDEMSAAFTEWNKTELDSYLIEITAEILKFKDADGTPLVEKIRDTAGQKGTGKWTGIEALEQGMPVTLIGEAVFARCLSALKSQRELAATKLGNGVKPLTVNAEEKAAFVDAIRQALLASKVVSYAQGFMLLAEAAKANGWKLNFGELCASVRVWLARANPDPQPNPNPRPNPHPGPHPEQARSPSCGAEAASSARPSSARSRRRMMLTPSCPTCCSLPTSSRPSKSASRRGARSSRRGLCSACPRPPSRRRSPSSMATAARGCPPTCCRPSATTSARTPSSASTTRASSSTPTGRAPPAGSPPTPTRLRCGLGWRARRPAAARSWRASQLTHWWRHHTVQLGSLSIYVERGQ